ncbi:hypothetical protein QFC22_006307 [Naganishia vaughanmartiniae]|uniref:Uncharacterized protein n=1 Tax=Naganishia vaughanmartiniae TaxID=1424756 RepID=A0ACC2WKE9_9TREE|nr:hypothetical protein QFC22_006307 [Naganishia vaughanmartiniae]
MNILRQSTTRTLIRAQPLTTRPFANSAVHRFPSPPVATASETFSSKSQPTRNHLSPEAERAYLAGSHKVVAAVNAARDVSESSSGRVEAFDGPARPRMRYDRPKEARELPDVKSRWKYSTLALGSWSLFLLQVTNAERLSSSVLRSITYQLRNAEEVRKELGGGVRYAENWWAEHLMA